jgi:hypothetical protein
MQQIVLFIVNGRRFIAWFAITDTAAPAVAGLRALFPERYPFETLSTADKVFELTIFILWPMFFPTAMAADVGGTRARTRLGADCGGSPSL